MSFLSSLTRIGHMLRKEFIQTLRDPHTRWLLVGPPAKVTRVGIGSSSAQPKM